MGDNADDAPNPVAATAASSATAGSLPAEQPDQGVVEGSGQEFRRGAENRVRACEGKRPGRAGSVEQSGKSCIIHLYKLLCCTHGRLGARLHLRGAEALRRPFAFARSASALVPVRTFVRPKKTKKSSLRHSREGGFSTAKLVIQFDLDLQTRGISE